MDQTIFETYVASGGPVMFALVPLAVASLGLEIQGLVNTRLERLAPRRLRVAAAGDRVALAAAVEGDNSPLSRAIREVAAKLPSAPPHAENDLVRDALDGEITLVAMRNSHLSAVFTIAPLLGLLGTVIGIMGTFFEYTRSLSPSVTVLSVGIRQALVTTVWGIAIALPAFAILHIIRANLFKHQTGTLPPLVLAGAKALATGGVAPE